MQNIKEVCYNEFIADITGQKESLVRSIFRLLSENPQESDAVFAERYMRQ